MMEAASAPLRELKAMIDLIVNPPQSGPLKMPVQDVLANYNGPRDLKGLLEALDFFECAQDPLELKEMINIIGGCSSILEVGSRLGGTLYRMASVLAPNSMVVSVDFPMADGTPGIVDPEKNLRHNCEQIAALGHHVELILGDSHSQGVVDKVREYGPYDFGFIDADHSYEGVKADWENYGPMCRVVGFHDIDNSNEPGCIRLWRELKDKYRSTEIMHKHLGMRLGIGIIYREEPI